MQKSIAAELEWVNANAKGQQKKGKARLRRYEDLTQQVYLQRPSYSSRRSNVKEHRSSALTELAVLTYRAGSENTA